MPHSDLHRIVDEADQQRFSDFSAETAKIATTANSEADDVFVTLPYSDNPSSRIEVHWRVGAKFVSGTAVPLYPQRGDRGIVIYSDTGEAWLIW